MAVSNKGGTIERQVVDVAPVRVRVMPDGRMSRQDAARYLGRAPKTLAQWATEGRDPRFVKVGGRVFYYQADLDSFIEGKAA
jgi:hypothetical protein